jgi:hypothetical protein
MLHLLANGLSRMVFEHLWDSFHFEDSGSGFFQLFQLCFHIANILGATCLLAMTKPLSGVCSIKVEESLCQLTSYALYFQFHEAFVTHFLPH